MLFPPMYFRPSLPVIYYDYVFLFLFKNSLLPTPFASKWIHMMHSGNTQTDPFLLQRMIYHSTPPSPLFYRLSFLPWANTIYNHIFCFPVTAFSFALYEIEFNRREATLYWEWASKELLLFIFEPCGHPLWKDWDSTCAYEREAYLVMFHKIFKKGKWIRTGGVQNPDNQNPEKNIVYVSFITHYTKII